MSEEPTITVACYNVHRCVGRDRRIDPARVASVIREMDADIVGLQEVSVDGDGETASHQANYLAEAGGHSVAFGPTLSRGLLHYGNALLTSAKIVSQRRHDLSVTGREPRGALDVELEFGEQRLRVLVTHMGLRRFERRLQIAQLAEIVHDARAPFTILMGDFNEWRVNAGPLAPLYQRLGRHPWNYRTFPASRPLFPLDRIWVRPRDALLDVKVHRSALASQASDHLPLVARVALD